MLIFQTAWTTWPVAVMVQKETMSWLALISNKYDAAQMLSLPPFATDFKLFAADPKTTIGDGYQNMLTCMCIHGNMCTYTHMYRLYIYRWCLICLLRFVLINTPGMGQILLVIQFIELKRFAHGRSWPWSCFAGYRGWRVVEKLMSRMTLWATFDTKKLTQS